MLNFSTLYLLMLFDQGTFLNCIANHRFVGEHLGNTDLAQIPYFVHEKQRLREEEIVSQNMNLDLQS